MAEQKVQRLTFSDLISIVYFGCKLLFYIRLLSMLEQANEKTIVIKYTFYINYFHDVGTIQVICKPACLSRCYEAAIRLTFQFKYTSSRSDQVFTGENMNAINPYARQNDKLEYS